MTKNPTEPNAAKSNSKRSQRQIMGFEKACDARAAMKLSPRERYLEKVYLALLWLHQWQQSTASILMLACSSSSHDFLTSMRDAGLVRIQKVLGLTFWLLTKKGVELLRSWLPPSDAVGSLKATRVVNMYAFEHDMYAQRLLAKRLKNATKTGVEWVSGRGLRAQMADSYDPTIKLPDAMFSDALETVYYEVERSKKKTPELELMLLNLARLIEEKPRARVEVHVGQGIAARYQSTVGGWLSRGDFRAWSFGANGALYEVGCYQMSETLHSAFERIRFIEVRMFS